MQDRTGDTAHGTQSQGPRPGCDDRGPAWPTVAFGVVCLAVAAVVLSVQLGEVDVDWGRAAPVAVAGVGALLMLVGLVALAANPRRRRKRPGPTEMT